VPRANGCFRQPARVVLNPIRVRREVEIRARPEVVWRLVRNPGEVRFLLPKDAALELLTDRFDEVGSRWRVTTAVGTKREQVTNEVLAIEEPVYQLIRVTSDRMTGDSRTTLEKTDTGTRMVIEATATFPSGLRTLPLRVLTAMLGPFSTERALRRMKRYVEGNAQ
jgi:uncharacterized protein YndB with AHSA1/START domain